MCNFYVPSVKYSIYKRKRDLYKIPIKKKQFCLNVSKKSKDKNVLKDAQGLNIVYTLKYCRLLIKL